MRSTLDAIDLVFTKLQTGNLKTTIGGKIYKVKRPLNSISEDVVISSLPIDNDGIQKGILNVNIHVPDLSLNINEVEDNRQPDSPRLKLLANMAIAELEEYGSDYRFYVQQQTIFESDDLKEHYVNIRLEFYSINL